MQSNNLKNENPTDVNNVLAVRSCALAKDDMGDDLCKYCPLKKKGVYGVDGGYMAGCEGSRCDDAYANYLKNEGNKANNQDKLDLRDRHLMSIIKNGIRIGDIEMVDGKITTSGIIGDNKYDNLVDLIKGLQGLDIKIDDFYW